MNVLGIIPARSGSRGVKNKNVRLLLDIPVICYTLDHALAASKLDTIAVTTDDPEVKRICKHQKYESIILVDRPDHLATDVARIDQVMVDCCWQVTQRSGDIPDAVVLLYANVPVRAEGIVDRAINFLEETGADSVQTMSPVGKFHPFWMYELENGSKAKKYEDNQVYLRQKLSELYYVDGAVGVAKWDVLEEAHKSADPHAFWGKDRRGLAQAPHDTVDIDTFRDLLVAEAALREKAGI